MPRSESSSSSPISHPYTVHIAPGVPGPKKLHICNVCERSFTTTGHLARHTRVHTGEKNHACPFPGCLMRCSRQDNLQQHYKIHLSSRSRKVSSRRRAEAATREIEPRNSSPSAQLFPSPPDTPPALVVATHAEYRHYVPPLQRANSNPVIPSSALIRDCSSHAVSEEYSCSSNSSQSYSDSQGFKSPEIHSRSRDHTSSPVWVHQNYTGFVKTEKPEHEIHYTETPDYVDQSLHSSPDSRMTPPASIPKYHYMYQPQPIISAQFIDYQDLESL